MPLIGCGVPSTLLETTTVVDTVESATVAEVTTGLAAIDVAAEASAPAFTLFVDRTVGSVMSSDGVRAADAGSGIAEEGSGAEFHGDESPEGDTQGGLQPCGRDSGPANPPGPPKPPGPNRPPCGNCRFVGAAEVCGMVESKAMRLKETIWECMLLENVAIFEDRTNTTVMLSSLQELIVLQSSSDVLTAESLPCLSSNLRSASSPACWQGNTSCGLSSNRRAIAARKGSHVFLRVAETAWELCLRK